MKLRLTKELPNGWFQDIHRSITDATELSQLEGLRRGIEDEANSFWISRIDRLGLGILYTYANYRYQHMVLRLQRKNKMNRITFAEFSKKHS